jgi:transcriptional regulator with XRE-family HTH domain
MTTAAQIRAARHLLGLSQADVAAATGLSLPTIKRVESERDVPVSQETLAAVRAMLETAGVEFLPQDNGGAGVRLRRG